MADDKVIEMQPTGTHTSPLSSTGTDHEPHEQQPDLPRFLRCLNWFHAWPPSARALIYIITGSGILLVPAIIDYIFFVQDRSAMFLSLQSDVSVGGFALTLWSVYFAILWAIYIASRWVILVLPAITMRIVRLLFGKSYVERIKPRLEYVHQLHSYLAVIVTIIIANVLAVVFFRTASPSTVWQPIFSNVLQCLLLGSIALCIEKLVLHIAAVGFHRKAYAERMVRSQYTEWVLERLYVAAKKRRKSLGQKGATTPPYQPWWNYMSVQKGKEKQQDGASVDHSPRLPLDQAETEKVLQHSRDNLIGEAETDASDSNDDVRTGADGKKSAPPLDKSKSFFDKSFNFVNAVTEVTGVNAIMRRTRGVLQDVTTAAIDTIVSAQASDTDIQSAEQARRLSRDIYYGLLPSGSKVITMKEFEPYFITKEECTRAFGLFDRDGNGDISFEEITQVALRQFREKRAIEKGVDGLSAVLGSLDRALQIVALFILMFFWLAIFGVNVTTYLVTLGSVIVTTFIVIGNALRGIFESIIFLFVLHPYDVDDKVEIEKSVYTVKEMTLNYTLLHRADGYEVTIPNSILASKVIFNYRRSPPQSESITVYAHINTSIDQIRALENGMIEFTAQHSRDFRPKVDLSIDEIREPRDTEPQGTLKIRLWINHRLNFQDAAARIARRNKFVLALRDLIVEHDVKASVGEVL